MRKLNFTLIISVIWCTVFLTCDYLENDPLPIIDDFFTSHDTLHTKSALYLQINVNETFQDKTLSYTWTCSGGFFENINVDGLISHAIWVAPPDTGLFEVGVVVSLDNSEIQVFKEIQVIEIDSLLLSESALIGNLGNRHLSVNYSPYIAIGDIVVDSGDTVTINPGVKVLFDGYYSLIVNGEIKGSSFYNSGIFFTTSGNNYQWKGIICKEDGSININKLSIENANIGLSISSDSSISHITFINNTIGLEGNSNIIKQCVFNGNSNGIDGSGNTIMNNLFIENDTGILSKHGNQIINNVFSDNEYGIYLSGYSYYYGATSTIGDSLLNNILSLNNIGYFYDNWSDIPSVFLYNCFFNNRESNIDNNAINRTYIRNIEYSIFLSPQFIGGYPYDYHLIPTSPLIDSGLPIDIFNDVDGTRNDIGAYGGPYGNW